MSDNFSDFEEIHILTFVLRLMLVSIGEPATRGLVRQNMVFFLFVQIHFQASGDSMAVMG